MVYPKLPALEEALNANEPGFAYLLVDGALQRDIVSRPPLGVETAGLQVPGVNDAESKAVLPLLMAWPPDTLTRRWLLPRSVHWAQETSGVTWLRSRLGLEELAAALGQRMDARLQDGTAILLRFADARILPGLPGTLDATQRATLFAPVEHWWHLDRDERLQALALPQAELPPHGRLPLVLTQAQLDTLLEIAEPDVVSMILAKLHPNGVKQLTRPALHAFVKRHVEQARALGMDAAMDFAIYCGLALVHGEEIFKSQRWTDAVWYVRHKQTTWPQALATMKELKPIA